MELTTVSTDFSNLFTVCITPLTVPYAKARHGLRHTESLRYTKSLFTVRFACFDDKLVKTVKEVLSEDLVVFGPYRFPKVLIGVDLATMGQYYQNPIELNSTCAVFGETEIIAHIVEGVDTPALVAGVNYSLFKRFSFMLDKLLSDIVVMSGGVALNQALACILEKEKPVQIVPLIHPQLNGALGCCVYGLQH